MTCILTYYVALQRELSDSAGANQPSGFSVSGIWAPNELK